MIQSSSLKLLASVVIVITGSPSLARAQQPTIHAAHATTVLVPLPKVYVDGEGLDLLNPPFLCRYVHGFKHLEGNGIRSRVPSPPRQERASELYEQSQEARDVGFAYLMYGRPEKAIARLKQSLVLWPDCASAYRWLAEAYEADGQKDEAITNYRLLFYGWPGKYAPGDTDAAKPRVVPADKPSDYDAANPEESDPTLLFRFSLLLQGVGKDTEARTVYERGMLFLSDKFSKNPLPPNTAAALKTPGSLEAATRVALAIDQMSYQDTLDARENLSRARQLEPASTEAAFYQQKLLKQ